MHSILKRLFPRDESLPLPNISIMGLDAAGKTTLLYKLASSEVATTIPSIGLNIETAKIQVPPTARGGTVQRFTARVADTGGCGMTYPLVRLVMIDDTVSAIVLVVDAHDTERLEASVEELSILLRGTASKREDSPFLLPILILANKIDLLPDGKLPDGFHAKFEELLKGRRFAFFETNITAAREPSSGLREAFAWLGDAIASSSKAETTPGNEKTPGTSGVQKKPVEKMLAGMRSPAALSSKLEDWLSRAENDPVDADELLRQFYALDLPSWDHYIHLRLAYVLLLKFGRREGKDKIFDGFKEYIDKSGKVHGKTFHTTMTYFWVQMVHLGIASMSAVRESHTLKAADGGDKKDAIPGLADDFARFLMVNPYLVDGQLWADYYSKEVLMSSEAKQGVKFPDIKKLPDVLYLTQTAKTGSESGDS